VEENKNPNNDDSEMMDSSSFASGQIDSSALSSFMPPYAESKKVNADQMDNFMDPKERKRAQTYYEHMQREAEERMCKFCDRQITEKDMNEGLMTMLQSTDCFHQVHIECFRTEAIKAKSQNENPKCPKC
jgi:hypothetical protein